MAGSYNHCVDETSGKLLVSEQLQGMLECCSGDVYEAVEEMYGMIWWLAERNTLGRRDYGLPEGNWSAAEWVERARRNYSRGLTYSPGTDGRLEEERDAHGEGCGCYYCLGPRPGISPPPLEIED